MKILIALSILIITLLNANEKKVELDLKKENILVIHSWHDILWDRTWGKGMHNVLGKDYNLIRYDIDGLRGNVEDFKKRGKIAFELAKQYDAVGIIFGDDYSLMYAGPYFQGTKYPGVYLGVNFSPRKYLDYSKANNITGLLERPLYKTAIKKLLKLFPKKETNILFLSDTPLGDESITDLAKLFKGSKRIKFFNATIDFKIKPTWKQWKEAVINAPKEKYDAIMVGSRYILRDEKGKYIEPEPEALKWMSQNSKLPFFGFYEDGVGPEFHVGGWLLGGIEHGESAGKIMYDILKNGKKPSEINPVFYNFGQYIFSRTLLKKYNLTLPDDILKQAQYIEDRHDLWDFEKYSFENVGKPWTPAKLYLDNK